MQPAHSSNTHWAQCNNQYGIGGNDSSILGVAHSITYGKGMQFCLYDCCLDTVVLVLTVTKKHSMLQCFATQNGLQVADHLYVLAAVHQGCRS